jgi:hypothetical protein
MYGSTHPARRQQIAATPRRARSRWSWLLGGLITLGILSGSAGLAAYADPALIPQAVDIARAVLGPSAVGQVESWVFQAQDQVRQARYQATGAAPQVEWAAPPAASQPARHPVAASPGAPSSSQPANAPTSPIATDTPALTAIWSPFVDTSAGQPALERALVGPDPSRPYATAALVRIDLRAAQLHLVAGTQEPRSTVRVARPGAIPAADRRPGVLLAAFNGGFKAANGEFGMAAGGATLLPPIDGLATLAIYRDGSVRLGTWGDDIRPTADLVAFRQNCPPLLDHGQLTGAATSDDPTLWGKTVGNKIATWRSGLGLSADRRYLIYAAGDSLTVPALAQALAAGGADRGMQLDINSWWARFVTYAPGTGGRLVAQKLLTSMVGDARQFLVADTRDFFYVTAR